MRGPGLIYQDKLDRGPGTNIGGRRSNRLQPARLRARCRAMRIRPRSSRREAGRAKPAQPLMPWILVGALVAVVVGINVYRVRLLSETDWRALFSVMTLHDYVFQGALVGLLVLAQVWISRSGRRN